jgi:hypothetical protein
MTVMVPRFFGIPQDAVRLGKMRSLSGFASKLYVALCATNPSDIVREN